jgi:predicted GIY-YIG superfamily endonuclease
MSALRRERYEAMVVYVLRDPDTNEACYVGMTRNVKLRVWQHMRHPEWTIDWWRNSLLRFKLKPVVEILEEVDTAEKAREREAFYIDKLLSDGAPLLNKVHGGSRNDQHERLKASKWVGLRKHKIY